MTPSAPADPRRTPRDAVYYVLAAGAGLVVGGVGAVFHMVVDGLSRWPDLVRTHLDGPLLYLAMSAVAAVMVAAAVALVRAFAPEAAGSGVQEIEGALEGLRPVRWKRVLPVKFVGGVLALGSGLVAGREGPTIHMGAAVTKALSDVAGLGTRDTRGLLAAGAAAGLAAAFNAPLAAILFVIEETRRQFPYGLRTYSAVILCSVASAVMAEAIGGTAPDMKLDVPEMPLLLLPAFLVLGAVLGAVGVAFNRVLVASLDGARMLALKVSPYLLPVLVGAAVGPLILLRPEATFGGETLAVSLPGLGLPALTLAGIVIIRFVMTMASYSTGIPGGIFAPILAMATAVGVLFATLLALAVPLPQDAVAAFGIAAMGGLFSATVRAPLVGMVLVAELTGAYGLLIPVILTCVTANLVAEALGGKPIYEVLLDRTLRLTGTPRSGAPFPNEELGGWDERERKTKA
ncbi:H(+)/Cl(-) exchange transporter ClcA [Xanthobacter oligotrophicus]|uniref:H(+)/Cl(-) exchange transporter ClcA n=1 Tax=Xanthobacter oligotrophicus TaxID=2607286 RepID=UPI0011F30741|nr:H(+)/Cl(-) exchange transporter ClcA [Xanthobacter oligotrophicus]MCG5234562.1 H(+)/Cl(-) exchange transporter ClcA [Xanthobacter oligotrophicus]